MADENSTPEAPKTRKPRKPAGPRKPTPIYVLIKTVGEDGKPDIVSAFRDPAILAKYFENAQDPDTVLRSINVEKIEK